MDDEIDRKINVTAMNFYWFRIDNKHMTEPWLAAGANGIRQLVSNRGLNCMEDFKLLRYDNPMVNWSLLPGIQSLNVFLNDLTRK